MADCAGCGAPFVKRRKDATTCSRRCWYVSRGQARLAPLDARMCELPECGGMFAPSREGQRCCSERHGKMLWNRESRADGRQPTPPWDDRRRDNYHRRRALQRAASTGAPVLLAEIVERDAGLCHLCGLVVPAETWPHPLSPSLDHVVPLTRGGAHDPSNVRLAHLRCNTAKGNREEVAWTA